MSTWGSEREVLGKKVKTLVVTFTSMPQGQKPNARGLKLTQTFIYGEGYGLIEWKKTLEASGQKSETSRKIISFNGKGKA